jgi:ABC-2 type transport system permease protein
MWPYARFESIRTLRNPRFLFLVTVVPLLLYVVGVQRDHGASGTVAGLPAGVWFLASSAAVGAMAAAMAGSGARLGADRASGWARQLRVTPLTNGGWLFGRLLSTCVVVLPVVLAVAVVAVTYGNVHLDATEWALLVLTLLLGTVPIALIGLAISLALKGESAGAAQTLGFLVLALLGGVFSDGQQTGWTKTVAELTPTHYFVRACRTAVNGAFPHLTDVAVLGLLTAILAVLVMTLYRRAE